MDLGRDGRGTLMHLRNSRGKRNSEQGQAIIEATFVVLPFFAILFLIIDLAMAVFVRCTLQHAVQEGLRYGVTSQTDGVHGQQTSIKLVVQHQALGFLNGDDALSKIKIQFYDKDTLALIDESAGYVAGANGDANILEVSVESFSWAPLAPLLHSGAPLQMTARSLGRMEPPPGGIPAPQG
jgi:Flp pilus assembly protein TadG